ncbi:hypothetical protein CHLRE_02g115950v5 [Chlamydomonas reinhardtii]|uniref:GH16 domain-containing protein n=1 Tax=Chlamydomonas reinhardtii TaxID=3055 RepID=A0A2K3E3A1_CHLRE|nr:uncharacterized protein CHLRE_02g115950v5 [Chlamydomonas reinhardtii]PNW87272.1 hypothetical protein CHLRE_02g115950v5 [Chlamydomonas reinhardtii]
MSATVSLSLVALLLALSHSFTHAKQVLRWSDEFRAGCKDARVCVNGGIDIRKWSFDLGDGTSFGPNMIGWGNWQRQCHTNSSANARVEAFPGKTDGMLVIQAGYSPLRTCYNENAAPSTTNYTSARLTTRDSAAFKWKGTAGNSTAVRIDVRLQVPMVAGTWPAAWMLPTTDKRWCSGCSEYGDGWCLGGEIDIMEHVNTNNFLISNVHFGGQANASWLDCHEKVGRFRAGSRAASWNVMTLIWDSTYLRFLANGKEVSRLNAGDWYTGGADRAANKFAPFDQDFFLILDMAVGGLYPGFNINDAAIAEGAARYNIDYVRVYDLLP